MKKIIISMLTLLFMITGICLISVDVSTVLAEENSAKFVAELLTPEEGQIPTRENYIFAGWYKDEACTDPYYSAPSEAAWAKFVSEEVLSVKLQLTKDTNAESPKTNMRLVTSVDSLAYRKVGFKVYFNNATKAVDTGTSKVYERIVASAESGVEYTYSPKVVSANSEYFATATLININSTNFDKDFYVRPYWVTYDGTTVYGESRLVQVQHGYTGNVINIPVKGTVSGTEVTVTYGEETATATVLKTVDEKDAYSQLLINLGTSGDRTALKSVTTFQVGELETKYRNLETTHEKSGSTTPLADTSWYEAYKDDTSVDSYVIATSADLYGLASIVDAGTTFEGEVVYLCSDIALNAPDVVNWKNIDGTLTGNGTPYTWEPIGSTTYSAATGWTVQMQPFSGTFDGQNHTISGLYINGTSEYTALFGGTSETAVVKNFRLTDGFLKGAAATASVAAEGNGLFENIYCDVTLQNTANGLGGLIARCYDSGIAIRNCWYAGQLLNKLNNWTNHVGGLIGHITAANNVVENCLMTGTVDAWKYCGGLIGTFAGTNMTVSNSLCLGEKGTTTEGMYSLIVTAPTDVTKTVILSNTYALDTLGTSPKYTGTIYNDAESEIADLTTLQVTSDAILGTTAVSNLTGLDFVNVWTTVQDKTPILRTFEDLVTDIIVDTTWYNDNDDTFVLYDRADMYGLASLVDNGTTFTGKTVKLGADITMNNGKATDWATTAPNYVWNPIGDAGTTNIFAGTFDGDGHTISGIYLNGSGWYNGLFAQISKDSVVRDFRLTNSYIKSTGSVLGSVVGYANGKVEKIYSDAIVVSSNKVVGGIVGKADGSFTMLECWFNGTVTATGNGNGLRATGGLIGEVAVSCVVKYSLNSGTIDASTYIYNEGATGESVVLPYVGGLIGTVTATSKNITLYATNLLNVGEVKYSGEATGGYGSIVGYIADGTTTAGKFSTGASDISYATEESCKVTANKTFTSIQTVKEADLIGYFGYRGLLGFDFDTYWTVVVNDDTTSNIDETGTPILQTFAKVVPSLPDTSWYSEDEGVGTAENPYILHNRADLYGLAELVDGGTTFEGKTVKLADDIVVNMGKATDWADEEKAPAYEWNPIGDASTNIFAGTFDGDGHTISGIYLNGSGWYNGLFAQTSATSKIYNFKLTNSYIKSVGSVLGSVAGYGKGTFEKIYSDVIVESTQKVVGGIVGKADGSFTMLECWFNGTVTATGNGNGLRATGGLIGEVAVSCVVKYSLNSGTIDASTYIYNEGATGESVVLPYVGGLIGYVSSTTKNITIYATNLLNVGEVKYSGEATGGYGSIVGYIADGTTTTGKFSEGTWDAVCATEESCGVTANKTFTSFKTVKEADILGYDGYCLLPEFDFDKYWTVVVDNETTMDVDESGTPILKAFAPVAPSDVAESTLQQTVGNNSEMEVALSNRVTMYEASEYGTYLAQGGCIVGNYYYQMLLTEKDATTAYILQYNLDNGTQVMSKKALTLGHANDVTYNSKTKELIICHSSGQSVSVISSEGLEDVENLTDTNVKTFDVPLAIYSISYNATRNQYVAGISGGTGFLVLDSEFETVYTVALSEVFSYTTQGIECDDKYVYCVYDEEDTILVYDWFGNYVSRINLQYDSESSSLLEPENISVTDDMIYLVVADANPLSRKYTYLYTIPVNLFTPSTTTE